LKEEMENVKDKGAVDLKISVETRFRIREISTPSQKKSAKEKTNKPVVTRGPQGKKFRKAKIIT